MAKNRLLNLYLGIKMSGPMFSASMDSIGTLCFSKSFEMFLYAEFGFSTVILGIWIRNHGSSHHHLSKFRAQWDKLHQFTLEKYSCVGYKAEQNLAQ